MSIAQIKLGPRVGGRGVGVGGVNILWYNILTPQQLFKNGILTMEYILSFIT